MPPADPLDLNPLRDDIYNCTVTFIVKEDERLIKVREVGTEEATRASQRSWKAVFCSRYHEKGTSFCSRCNRGSVC